jgi:uncharacterized phiE125 gp8 family phage protein
MLKLQQAATLPAVSLVEAKVHLRVDVTDDDALITGLIAAATLDAEHLMGRAVMPQKWLLTLDTFEAVIALQMPAVTALDSIKYVDSTGALITLLPAVYQFANASDYTASVTPAYGQAWPATRAQPGAVQIVISCGYADAVSVPESIKAWVKLRVGALYANRESVSDRQTFGLGMADSLLDRYRVWAM